MNEEQILEMLENRQYKELKIELEKMYPVDLASCWKNLTRNSESSYFVFCQKNLRRIPLRI